MRMRKWRNGGLPPLPAPGLTPEGRSFNYTVHDAGVGLAVLVEFRVA